MSKQSDREWLEELFEFETYHECEQDADGHLVAIDPLGNRTRGAETKTTDRHTG